MNYQCAVLGDITLDRFLLLSNLPVLPSPSNPGNFVLNLEIGHKIPVSEIVESIGGNAYNITYGLSLLNIHSTLVSSIGNDDISRYILEILNDSNLDTDHIVLNDISGINQSTILSLAGDRIVLSHHKPKDYTNLSLPEAEWLYITSLSAGSESILDKLIQNNNTHKLVLNPGSYLLKHNLELIQKLIAKTEIIFVNKEEAQHITNKPEIEDIPTLIQALHNMGAKIIGLTDGGNGAYVSNIGESILHIPSRKVEKVLETTGAGDAFAAAFLAGFIHSGELQTALKWGIIQSSSVLTQIGSVNGLLLLEDVINISKTLEPEIL